MNLIVFAGFKRKRKKKFQMNSEQRNVVPRWFLFTDNTRLNIERPIVPRFDRNFTKGEKDPLIRSFDLLRLHARNFIKGKGG